MQIGLFGAGAVSKSWLARHPRLPQRLGPVAAPSYRLASRIANTIGAGHAVKDCNAFAPCRLVFICVPGSSVASAVETVAAAPLAWPGKIVLLCDGEMDSRSLAALRGQGAAAGSVRPIEGSSGNFGLEGDPAAVREARRLVHELKGRAVEFRPGCMDLYTAGVTFASSLFTPLMAACTDCLAASLRDARSAPHIAEALFQNSLRAYGHAGRKSWNGPLASGDAAAVGRELAALSARDPALARYYRAAAAFALQLLDRHPELLPTLRRN
jgi:predicted short-subunit dehydrogenase-like oxidoreductase (DUF2520 family)